MNWQSNLMGDPLTWLATHPDPGVRYLALRDLLDHPADDPELIQARRGAYAQGAIAAVLAELHPEGYWAQPGPGYNPKYFSTVWAISLLAQLGASSQHDPRIAAACDYLLAQTLCPHGQLSASGAPSGTADCLQGNLCWALATLGVDPQRLETAMDWMARSQTGDGIAPASQRDAPLRYYAGKCGPCFACGANNRQPCAWGAAKVMLAFGGWPRQLWPPAIEQAVQVGVDFLLGCDPATAGYPNGYAAKPSGNWWKFGFPVFYVTDILQIAEALVSLGYAHDQRLANTLQLIRQKQDPHGGWLLEYDYAGKTWGDYGPKKQPNPWVTLRALRVLKAAQ